MNERLENPGRMSGILLHPTSLPGRHGIGTLGFDAYRFVDFLALAGQHLWQVLPLCPTGCGNSPYQGLSAFAGNPMMVDLDLLVKEGDLEASELADAPPAPPLAVDFEALVPWKSAKLRLAAERFLARPGGRAAEFSSFCKNEAAWLDDFALFVALREENANKSWKDWDPRLVAREKKALAEARGRLAGAIDAARAIQFLFYRQWLALKRYANERQVYMVGDLPIFVAYDSSDVWQDQHLYHLDEKGAPTVVAGVPPDYFSEDGQLWGNPLYRWEVMARDGYEWWCRRLAASAALFDLIRVDHFRGFEAYWEIPAGEKTARNGRWVPGPDHHFFATVKARLGTLPLIAEDLGIVTDGVEALRDDFDLPGMKVLQFAFDGKWDNPYLPHNHVPNSVVYTGTHDNDTTRGWWETKATPVERAAVRDYLGREPGDISWEMIRLATASVADLCVYMFQDLVCLGTEHRMNVPGTTEGNWRFRAAPHMFHPDLAGTLAVYARTYGRSHRA